MLPSALARAKFQELQTGIPILLSCLCNRAASREELKQNGKPHSNSTSLFLCICILRQSFSR